MKLFLSSLLLLSFETAVHASCETAYAYCAVGSEPRCFIEDSASIQGLGNKWGWTHNVTVINPSDTPIECTLYAGAGQCDLSRGAIAGTAKISANTFQITLDGWEYGGDTTTGADGAFVHFYHGSEKYPRNGDDFTVAPGQYSKPFAYDKQTLENLGLSFPYPAGGVFPFPTGSPPLATGQWFILHASVCPAVGLRASTGPSRTF